MRILVFGLVLLPSFVLAQLDNMIGKTKVTHLGVVAGKTYPTKTFFEDNIGIRFVYLTNAILDRWLAVSDYATMANAKTAAKDSSWVLLYPRSFSTDSSKALTNAADSALVVWDYRSGIPKLWPSLTIDGADTVASATNLFLGNFNNVVVTGTTQIDSISTDSILPGWALVYLEFSASLQVTDGKNLKLAGNFSATDDDILVLQRRGNIFYEVSRSSN